MSTLRLASLYLTLFRIFFVFHQCSISVFFSCFVLFPLGNWKWLAKVDWTISGLIFSKLNTHLHVSCWWPQLALSFWFRSHKYLAFNSLKYLRTRWPMWNSVWYICVHSGCLFLSFFLSFVLFFSYYGQRFVFIWYSFVHTHY